MLWWYFLIQIFYNPEYWSGPRESIRDLTLCSQALYRLSCCADAVKTAFLRQYSLSLLSYFFSLDGRSYSNLYFDQEIKTEQIWKISPIFIHLNYLSVSANSSPSITSWCSLNFIRLLRIVITPSVTENDSKQSDEFQATAGVDQIWKCIRYPRNDVSSTG